MDFHIKTLSVAFAAQFTVNSVSRYARNVFLSGKSRQIRRNRARAVVCATDKPIASALQPLKTCEESPSLRIKKKKNNNNSNELHNECDHGRK